MTWNRLLHEKPTVVQLLTTLLSFNGNLIWIAVFKGAQLWIINYYLKFLRYFIIKKLQFSYLRNLQSITAISILWSLGFRNIYLCYVHPMLWLPFSDLRKITSTSRITRIFGSERPKGEWTHTNFQLSPCAFELGRKKEHIKEQVPQYLSLLYMWADCDV